MQKCDLCGHMVWPWHRRHGEVHLACGEDFMGVPRGHYHSGGLLRYFDLEYWQMREALGYSIPTWADRRWPRRLAGNAGHNPFKCGTCGTREKYPEPNPRVHELERALSPFAECVGHGHGGNQPNDAWRALTNVRELKQ